MTGDGPDRTRWSAGSDKAADTVNGVVADRLSNCDSPPEPAAAQTRHVTRSDAAREQLSRKIAYVCDEVGRPSTLNYAPQRRRVADPTGLGWAWITLAVAVAMAYAGGTVGGWLARTFPTYRCYALLTWVPGGPQIPLRGQLTAESFVRSALDVGGSSPVDLTAARVRVGLRVDYDDDGYRLEYAEHDQQRALTVVRRLEAEAVRRYTGLRVGGAARVFVCLPTWPTPTGAAAGLAAVLAASIVRRRRAR